MTANPQQPRYPEILEVRVLGDGVQRTAQPPHWRLDAGLRVDSPDRRERDLVARGLLPPPQHIGVVVALDAGFAALVTVVSQDGRPVIGAVEVGLGVPHLAIGGLSASAYHALPVTAVLKVAKRVLDQIEEPLLRERGFVRELLEGPRPRGRKGWPDSFHARIAKHYVDAMERDRRRPVEQVARILDMKPSQVRDALHVARTREPVLLTRSGQGRAGGRLTEKALEILAATS
jgi:transposase-like protein